MGGRARGGMGEGSFQPPRQYGTPPLTRSPASFIPNPRSAVASQPSKRIRIIARLMWVLPALLLVLGINQAKVAHDIRYTLENGAPATAEITNVHGENRVEISYDYVDLRVTMEDGQVLTREKLSLPHSMFPLVENQGTVEVRVLPGAAQEIVIASTGGPDVRLIGRPQWRLAAINAVMCLIGLVILTVGIWAWNRYLARRGDPGEQHVAEWDEEADVRAPDVPA